MKLTEHRRISERYFIERREKREFSEGYIWLDTEFVNHKAQLKSTLNKVQKQYPKLKLRIIREKQTVVQFPPTDTTKGDAV